MRTEADDVHSRRALANEAWRWLPGALGVRDAPGFADHGQPETRDPEIARIWGSLPDFTDPATRGTLLFLVREIWADPTLSVLFDHGSDDSEDRAWIVGRYEGDGIALRGHGTSEVDALLSSLERGVAAKARKK